MTICNARCANCANVKLCNGGASVFTPIKCNAYCPIEPWHETNAEWETRKRETAEIINSNAKEWHSVK